MKTTVKIANLTKASLERTYTKEALDEAYSVKTVPIYHGNKIVGTSDVNYAYPSCTFTCEFTDEELINTLSKEPTPISFSTFGVGEVVEDRIEHYTIKGIQTIPTSIADKSNVSVKVKK